jgi:DNA topoisomerase-2
MHLYDADGRLRRFDTAEAVIETYFPTRRELYAKRKQHQLRVLAELVKRVSNRARFAESVIEGRTVIFNKSKDEIIEQLKRDKFDAMGEREAGYDYLLNIPLFNLSREKMNELINERNTRQQQHQELEAKLPDRIWLEELMELRKHLLKDTSFALDRSIVLKKKKRKSSEAQAK